jgi:hypothetical protein
VLSPRERNTLGEEFRQRAFSLLLCFLRQITGRRVEFDLAQWGGERDPARKSGQSPQDGALPSRSYLPSNATIARAWASFNPAAQDTARRLCAEGSAYHLAYQGQ